MAIMEGPLSKWTNVMKGWQYRWFVLDENSGLLSYYTSKEKMMRGARRGCVRLKGAVIGIDDEDDSTFTITVDQKTFHFQARDAEEKEKWIGGLETTILRHSQPVRRSDNLPTVSIAQFDRKLAETDAYLQLLIDQVKSLESKIDQCPEEDARAKYCSVKQAAETMIESIKQCILLLQMSKPSPVQMADRRPITPRSSLTHDGSDADSKSSDTKKKIKTVSSTLSKSSEQLSSNSKMTSNDLDLLLTSVPPSTSLPNLSGHENSTDSVSIANGDINDDITPVIRPSDQESVQTPEKDVPATSYSSSEDEDFFDAEEGSPVKSKPSSVPEDDSSESKPPPPVIASKDDHFDELYDCVDEDELDSLDQHGSIIKHLISQVRIGMDLTKIVLPTFILEKRSLLEMYADFLAHPDLFVSIADQATPRERFVQCVRWYLSAFHAGRKSPVAKKPYNPILGETFMCYYDLPDTSNNETPVPDGPIPWATQENVAFIAEQVSHHPPISAFYAEHHNKRISLDGYIWTKSKFLGLSIGVHMIGQAVLSVMDHDEDYIITFPNGYGRSILTVPWVELGGKVNVSCAKTGFYANIDFHTKPFYGGKKDQITAELFARGDKKPFCVVKGEWNGVMWAKYDSGMNEKFVDTKSMPIYKKMVQKLENQGEYESRRLWKDVTYNLKNKNIEEATEAKRFLEQRQRDEAKDRKERNVKWQTKHFTEVGEHWVYKNPLVERLPRQMTST